MGAFKMRKMSNAEGEKSFYRYVRKFRSTIVFMVAGLLLLNAGGCMSTKSASTRESADPTTTMLYKYGDVGLKKASKEGLVSTVDKTVKKGNGSITVKETYYDKARVSVALIGSTKDMIAKEFDYTFYCNGKPMTTTAKWERFMKVVGGQQYDIMSLDLPPDVSSKLILKVVAKRFSSSGDTLIVEVPVDRAPADAITREASVLKKFVNKDKQVTIRSVLLAPSATVIRYNLNGSTSGMLPLPQLFDRNNKKIQIIGRSGITGLLQGNKVVTSEYYDNFAPIQLDESSLSASFTFSNVNPFGVVIGGGPASKVIVTAHFVI
jgi:hypothetical protein